MFGSGVKSHFFNKKSNLKIQLQRKIKNKEVDNNLQIYSNSEEFLIVWKDP